MRRHHHRRWHLYSSAPLGGLRDYSAQYAVLRHLSALGVVGRPLTDDGMPMNFVDPSANYFELVRRLAARRTYTEVGELDLLNVLAAHYYYQCHIRDPSKLCEVLRRGHGIFCEVVPGGGIPGIRPIDECDGDEVCGGMDVPASSSSSPPSSCPELLVIPVGLE